jgi:hypothetical protein
MELDGSPYTNIYASMKIIYLNNEIAVGNLNSY